FHAIGDRAILQVADCYRRALRKNPGGDRRLRIEHCELPSAASIETIRNEGIHLSIQPTFEHLWGGPGKMYEKRLGPERLRRTNPFRTFAEKEIPLAGGSDSDVTPMDPLLGIFSSLTRPNESERLTIQQALEAFTLGGARAGFEEHSRGSLEIGKSADLVVLTDNPLEVPPEHLNHIEILATVAGGNIRYQLTREPARRPPSPRRG
ncbi:MAG: amidohydrolase family protein, partial [Desulfobacterales bacterium]|nr:amidohydrolase family protein [Desulfobacterales bacterium]